MNQLRPARLRMIGVSVGFAVIATLGLNGPAHADDLPSDTVTAIEQAIEDADQTPAAENDAVSLPSDSNDTTSLASEAGTLEFDVPATGDATETTDAGVLFDGADDDTSIAVESTDLGVRALIHIDSENAPERFEFPVSGDVTSLTLNDDGSVNALNTDGEIIAVATAPWAVDATGREVPTHYEINGTTLIQIVEHRSGGFTYGITADPWWNPFSWNWGKIKKAIAKGAKKTADVSLCAAAITVAVLPAAKGAKVIKELGGAREAAKLFVGAGKISDIKKMLPGAAASILGISSIKSNCKLK